MTADELRALFRYDPNTGLFTRLKTTGATSRAGQIAGYFSLQGYRKISIGARGCYRQYAAHRLAWLYMTGEWPAGDIDHINLDKADNRWQNLRIATIAQNAANRLMEKRNRTGLKGVSFHKPSRKWRAKIRNNWLGVFGTPEEAHAAYALAAAKEFGEFARAGECNRHLGSLGTGDIIMRPGARAAPRVVAPFVPRIGALPSKR